LDTCSSAIGYWVLGYGLSQGGGPVLDGQNDTVQFFFKFTFASNTATIIGGALCGQPRKMRLVAIPIYAFMISGFIHPMVARWVWSTNSSKHPAPFGPGWLSPYQRRYCLNKTEFMHLNASNISNISNMYVLDFAGGGAVHLLGGISGLMLLLVLKLDNYLLKRKLLRKDSFTSSTGQEKPTKPKKFLDWMYPADGGGDLYIEDSALGVLILWTTWFAFNCGSTESVESNRVSTTHDHFGTYSWMYYNIPGRIAMNMIICAGSAGLVAVLIAGGAQLRTRATSTNANEIANGILGALVAITSGCPFVYPEWAAGIGAIAVFFYHFGCWIEFKLDLEDTARVFPVHGMCGFWSMLAPGLYLVRDFVNQVYEGLCYCHLYLPHVSHLQRFGYQLLGITVIAVWSALTCGILFLVLNFIPVQKIATFVAKCLCIYKAESPEKAGLVFKRGLLFTCPNEYTNYLDDDDDQDDEKLRNPLGGSSGSHSSSLYDLSLQTGRRDMYREETPLLATTHNPGDPTKPSTKRRSLDIKAKENRSSHGRSTTH
jgi:Amt family ammonium transporter